jgi:hypothetical protein
MVRAPEKQKVPEKCKELTVEEVLWILFQNLHPYKAKFGRQITHKIVKYLKITVCWDVTPRSLVHMYQRFGGTYCLRFHI